MNYTKKLPSLEELKQNLYMSRGKFKEIASTALEKGMTLQRAHSSPVYKLLWGDSNVNVNANLDYLKGLPLLTGDFYTSNFEEKDTRILTGPLKEGADSWLSSSGSKKRKFFPFSEYDSKNYGLYSSRVFIVPGVKKEDAIISLGADPPHVTASLLKWISESFGNYNIQITRGMNPEYMAEELLKNSERIKGICGVTLIAVRFLQNVSEKFGKLPKDLFPRLNTAVIGGEMLTAPKRKAFKDLANISAYNALGSLELGLGAIECSVQKGMHVFADNFIYSLKTNEGLKYLWEWEIGDIGSLIVTTPHREAFPLVNYNTKDILEVVDTECSCGITHPKIKVLGRDDDVLNFDGAKAYPTHLDEWFDSVTNSGTLRDRQIHWYKDEDYGFSTLDILVSGDIDESSFKKELMENLFKSSNLSQLAANYEADITKINVRKLSQEEFDKEAVKTPIKTVLIVKKFEG